MNLLIDVDGVVADTHRLLIRQLNKERGWHLKASDITCYDAVVNGVDIGKEMTERLKYPAFALAVPVTPGFIQAHSLLYKAADMSFVTARPHKAKVSTETWLYIHGIGTAAWFANAEERVAGYGFYVPRSTILIDDNASTCDAWVTAGGRAILFDRPWNRGECSAPRAKGWKGVLGRLL